MDDSLAAISFVHNVQQCTLTALEVRTLDHAHRREDHENVYELRYRPYETGLIIVLDVRSSREIHKRAVERKPRSVRGAL